MGFYVVVHSRGYQITAAQKNAALLMRKFRLQLGMTMPTFGKMISMDSGNLAPREFFRVPWKESELQAALPVIILHLEESLKQAKLLADSLLPNRPQPNP
jgi:hypothetical protein